MDRGGGASRVALVTFGRVSQASLMETPAGPSVPSPSTNYLTHLFGLSGSTALVSGSSRGLGRVFVQALGQAGCRVAVNGRSPESVDAVVAELGDLGITAIPAPFDITDHTAVASAVAGVQDRFGQSLDILVNNAGINRRHQLQNFPLSDWQAVLDANLTSAFVLSQAVVPGMIARGTGVIVNIASLLSAHARRTIAAYAAAKAGLSMLTKSMATEWGEYGIRANAIAPGYILTDITRPLHDDPDRNPGIMARLPVGRWGEPADLVGPVLFLSSEAADYIHGTILPVDGGWLAR